MSLALVWVLQGHVAQLKGGRHETGGSSKELMAKQL